MVTAASARTRASSSRSMCPPRGRRTSPRIPASATSTFEPPPSIVTGTPCVVRETKRQDDFFRGARFDKQVGRAADLERRHRRKRPIGRPRVPARVHARARPASASARSLDVIRSSAPSRRARARGRRPPTRACSHSHGTNRHESPGPSWPANGRSAAVTTATIAYPPVVWRSAMSSNGDPPGRQLDGSGHHRLRQHRGLGLGQRTVGHQAVACPIRRRGKAILRVAQAQEVLARDRRVVGRTRSTLSSGSSPSHAGGGDVPETVHDVRSRRPRAGDRPSAADGRRDRRGPSECRWTGCPARV